MYRYPTKAALVRLFAALLVAASIVVAGGASEAVQSEGGAEQPTRGELDRLEPIEPYIRYFTSLAYGGADSRVSPTYIRALILTESRGDPDAHSRKGARGLTQIMPSTARLVLAKLAKGDDDYLYIDESAFGNFEADDLYDPALNILLACYLTATYNDRYQGRTELVAAAWNAGPSAVARYGNRPPPYRETRIHLDRVLGYMDFFEPVRLR